MRGAQSEARTDAVPKSRRALNAALVLLGVLCFGYFAISALRDLDGFLTKENAEAFLVGPVLTIALIPLLYVWAWISQWEQRRIRRRFIAGPNSAA